MVGLLGKCLQSPIVAPSFAIKYYLFDSKLFNKYRGEMPFSAKKYRRSRCGLLRAARESAH